MKSFLTSAFLSLTCLCLVTGCVAAIGNRGPHGDSSATLGQQLLDLKKAKDAGALTDAEYQQQKTKLLGEKAN